ncbi:protein kinase domain-containing protein [Brunnivagina elsteri]|uniref:non-specific serine/threonine protein kinase n=1 Tax=Brunnivagina elsteri CCALA 953 TaxID=987040 RepID=A0A2A2TAY2_9CYAN|nr:protein kinase [Calothrix elsteri]PAX49106.1 serine/threonine protein kinase [Calothrix elsteri CCALA 953]
MIGQLLAGHYKVLKVLGEGGFGQTYIVEDIHLPGHPQCVLKHIKPTSTEPQVLETSRRLFQREAEILQKLGDTLKESLRQCNQIPKIPRLLAYFEENQEFYLVQEFIRGHTLSHELADGQKWTEGQVTLMLTEILSILEIVHNHGVIHRDIKPDNIIRRESDGQLVLIDFGAIKQLRSSTAVGEPQQRVTIAIGTPGYMPSEQTRRLPRSSSDIYALGMMGIQAITGVNPRELEDDPNTGEFLWQHLTPVTPGLATVLTKMTRYHFKERYQSAAEALQALRDLRNLVEAPTVTPMTASANYQSINHQSTNQESTNYESTNYHTLHELTLEWHEDGEIRTCTIEENQQSKNFGRIRIGRDPQVCDIIIPEVTVSALHAEIFFNGLKNRFYIRNLRQKNPPIVDGQMLLAGEMLLTTGSSLRLGRQQFKVSNINIKQVPVEHVFYSENKSNAIPTENFAIAPNYEPITKTAPPQQAIHSQRQQAQSRSKPSVISPIPQHKPFVMGMGMAAVVTMVGGLVLLQTGTMGKSYSSYSEHNFIAQQPKLCRVITSTGGNYMAKLRPEPQTEIGAMKQLSPGEKVLFLKLHGDFVKVRLADGTQGWVFGDQIKRCNT